MDMDTVKGVFEVIKEICAKIIELKAAHDEFKKLEPLFKILLDYSSELERYQELKNLEMGVKIALKKFAQDVQNVQDTVNEAKTLVDEIKKAEILENAGYFEKIRQALGRKDWNNKFKNEFDIMTKGYDTFKKKLLEDKTPVGRLLLKSPTTGVFWSNTSCTNPINYLDFYDNLISYYPKFFVDEDDKKHLLGIVVLMCDTKSQKTEEKHISIASLLIFFIQRRKRI